MYTYRKSSVMILKYSQNYKKNNLKTFFINFYG